MKFGRRPAVHTRHTMRRALALARALDPLGAPPAASDDYVAAVNKATQGDWGMLGNDSVGDCTCADSGHQIMLHTANAGTIVQPTAADVLAMYSAISGYDGTAANDTGCDETSVCNYMQSTGLCGQKSAGSGMIDPANLDHMRWAVQLFGACRIGIVVGEDFVQQYQNGQAWTTPTTDPNAGGHDVPVVRYDATYAYVVTWGRLQAVAWSLMANAAFLDEAHAEVYGDWIAANGNSPSGFNLAQLLTDLQTVA